MADTNTLANSEQHESSSHTLGLTRSSGSNDDILEADAVPSGDQCLQAEGDRSFNTPSTQNKIQNESTSLFTDNDSGFNIAKEQFNTKSTSSSRVELDNINARDTSTTRPLTDSKAPSINCVGGSRNSTHPKDNNGSNGETSVRARQKHVCPTSRLSGSDTEAESQQDGADPTSPADGGNKPADKTPESLESSPDECVVCQVGAMLP